MNAAQDPITESIKAELHPQPGRKLPKGVIRELVASPELLTVVPSGNGLTAFVTATSAGEETLSRAVLAATEAGVRVLLFASRGNAAIF